MSQSFSQCKKNRAETTIERVLGTEDPYQILNVPRNINEVEIDKAYKKLCLILHPDRCKHQKAEQAFKKILNAKNKLIEIKKRQKEFSSTDFFKMRHQSFDNGVFDSFYSDFDPNSSHSYSFRYRQRRRDFFSEIFQNDRFSSPRNRNFFYNRSRNTTIFDTDDSENANLRLFVILFVLIFFLYVG